MQISVADPVFQTKIVIVMLVLAVILTAKKKPAESAFGTSFTNELKGVAILMVIFSHVGYFLFSDHSFSYPLSVAGGKGVDIFLFLSGFGLTASALKSNLSIKGFYRKRLPKIFIPMWVVLAVFLVLDAVLLSRHYHLAIIISNFFGFFPSADIWLSVNSPLWYFSAILFYYLLFPLVFSKRLAILSALFLLSLGYFLSDLKLPVSADVLKLYKLHYLAFPLGMVFATFLQYIRDHPLNLPPIPRLDALFAKFFAIVLLIGVFCYTAIYSGVGGEPVTEQLISLGSLGCLVIIFYLKGFYSRFLTLLGIYSYELYLFHWPLMSRYDFLYKRFSASVATVLYFTLLLIIGFFLKMLVNRLVAIMTLWKTPYAIK